jgi:magnesium chelatase family protein
MNACPCGNLGSRRKPCVCRAEAIEQYQSRISGPLLDRIDLQLEVSEISYEEIQRPGTDLENSQTILARVEACRNIQRERFANTPIRCNAQMGVPEIRQFCALSPEGHKLMQRVIDRLGMSARAHHRILKVARTIADMAGDHNISPAHLSEAIGYRILDRKRMPASNA